MAPSNQKETLDNLLSTLSGSRSDNILTRLVHIAGKYMYIVLSFQDLVRSIGIWKKKCFATVNDIIDLGFKIS